MSVVGGVWGWSGVFVGGDCVVWAAEGVERRCVRGVGGWGAVCVGRLSVWDG